MQNVNFGVEILVHDDASTDGTSSLVASFAKAYPELVRATIQSENQYSKGANPMKTLRESARGRYIAFCEGDDIWRDANKLALQVHALESDPGIVMTGHKVIAQFEDGRLSRYFNERLNWRGKDNRAKSLSSLGLRRLHFTVPTSCRVFRNLKIDIPESLRVVAGDAVLQSLLSQYGRYEYIDAIGASTYTIHSQGAWSSKGREYRLRADINLYSRLGAHYWAHGDVGTALYFGFRVVKLHLKQYVIIGSRVLPPLRWLINRVSKA